MPIDPAAASAVLSGGSSITQSLFNIGSQKKQNQRNQDFAKEMYDLQRKDSLSDWAMENEFNSPKSQMARLRDANLNPNMVYGHGATAEGGSVRGSSATAPPGQAPQADLRAVGDSIMSYQDVKLREAQTDNLHAQNNVIKQDAILRSAQILQTLSSANTTAFDLKMKERLKEISAEMASEELRFKKAGVDNSEQDLELKKSLYDPTIKKAFAEARDALNKSNASTHLEKRALQELDNLQKDGDLKKFQINLNRLGINSSDPWYLRLVTQLLGKHVPTN